MKDGCTFRADYNVSHALPHNETFPCSDHFYDSPGVEWVTETNTAAAKATNLSAPSLCRKSTSPLAEARHPRACAVRKQAGALQLRRVFASSIVSNSS